MTTAMDATELARWTRFAAKGGIGKCTAVQDCVAESPEDLMFLKDDEITVLMHLSGQSGFYLGYCEGVVGRFRGDHVRFHGKLKRPVMTKRASASAVSVAGSPAPSVTPSPRMPLSPLATSSSISNAASASTPPSIDRDRDSKALSDPFDLELDTPPNANRRSEEMGTNANNEQPGGDRRRLTRGADDLPGLEMFLPRSRSGSRSRPTSRGPPPADDEKSTKRRTRIMTPQHLQFTSPRSDSLDIPPSPIAPPSPVSPHQPKQADGPERPADSERQPEAEEAVGKERPEGEIRINVEDEKPRISMTSESLRVQSPTDKDESSLYDGASARSSFYSTHSYRSSVFGGGNGLSAAATDAFARLSGAETDDGGIGMGIGLSMLQDIADDDDGDDEESGTTPAAPPTPRPDASRDAGEQKNEDYIGIDKRNGDVNEHGESDEDSDYDDDDDGSYWDGADIYDSYRYSRFSVMTKNSRRKSRFSVMSRGSVGEGAAKKKPPVPLDAETRLRADSALSSTSPLSPSSPSSPSKDESEKRKHVPPPLNFVKSSPGPSSAALLSPLPAHSPISASNRSTAEYSIAGSDQHSPLLHTNFASPRSSDSHATSFGTNETDGQSTSPGGSISTFSGAATAAAGVGAASTLRQKLEYERSASPTPLSSPIPPKETESLDVEAKRGVYASPGRGIVVDDDEPVHVTVVLAEDAGRSPSQENDHAKQQDHAARDSVQSAVSSASIATSTSDTSDVSGVMRKVEKELASASGPDGTASPPINVRSTLADGGNDGSPTPTAAEFSVGATTKPLRVHDRSARSTPSPSPAPTPIPDQVRQQHQHQRVSPSPTPREQQPIRQYQHQLYHQQDAKPSQGSQLLRPDQALFLPHPNAPRPNPAVISGQRTSTYGMPPVHEPMSQRFPTSGPSAPEGIPGSSLEATLRAASASRVGPAGVPHRPTIYGKPVVDLASADGPVAMVWSLSPFQPEPGSRANSPAPGSRVPRRSATAGVSPLSQTVAMTFNPPSPSPNQPNFSTSGIPSSSAFPPVQSAFPIGSTGPAPALSGQAPFPSSVSDNTTPPSGANSNSTTSTSSNVPLLRPNFTPRVGTSRPRSRSFSDIVREVPVKPVLKERAKEEGSRPMRVASVQSFRETASISGGGAPSSNVDNGSGVNGRPLRQSTVNGSSPPKRSMHTPSPLSRPENNAVLDTPRASSFSNSAPTSSMSPTSRGINIPRSPLGQSFISSSANQMQVTPAHQAESSFSHSSDAEGSGSSGLGRPVIPGALRPGVRQVSSVDNFRMERQDVPLAAPSRTILQPLRRNSGPVGSPSGAASVPVPAQTQNSTSAPAINQNSSSGPSPVQRLRRLSSPSTKRHERTTSQQSQMSSNSELRSATSPPPNTASSSTPSPVHRSNSIKSKMSLSHLRLRHNAKEPSTDTQTPSPSTGPATPVFDFDNQPETVQVQDAEFEMIRPTMRRVSSEPMSDDSVLEDRPSLQQDSTIDSPVSGSGRSLLSPYPSTIAESVTEQQHPHARKSTDDAAAHRARELKWMQMISSVPPSQARKNRKVRRLVVEGVPSSVRYLVWSHLTDSKAKRIPGVYGQLAKRGRVAASEVIERDAARCFADQPHLQDPKGPLVGLLQTYLTMVPDIQYQTSLALVAGHLLLQSPEEDAFWIFTSIMDIHLRAYFSPRSVQMDADALVFAKVVESLHPQLAKKLFMGLSIPPIEVCRTWFTSVFATTLPQDYVNRIWDLYLCDGPPFLFRVGLAILSCCRTAIESSNDRTAVLNFLARPEILSLLPEDPEEFVHLVTTVKVKDDDIRKQRAKVETEMRAKTQSAARSQRSSSGGAPRLVSSISLPRAGPPAGVAPL